MTSNGNFPPTINRPYSAGDSNDAGSALVTGRAFSINEFCRQYGIGRTMAYAEIATGRLRAVKAGRRTLITHNAAEAWLASLERLGSLDTPMDGGATEKNR
jgi:excisionase family DNA binding protein